MQSGITRRMDSLGRIVLPKEFRKKLRINDGELLELSVMNDVIVIKKYEILNSNDKFIKNLIKIIKEDVSSDVSISNLDVIVFSTNNANIGKSINSINNANKYNINPNGDLLGYIVYENLESKTEDIELYNKVINSYYE